MAHRRATISPQCRGAGQCAWVDHKYPTADVFQEVFGDLFLLFNVLLVNSYKMSDNTFTTSKFQDLFWLGILTQTCWEFVCVTFLLTNAEAGIS